MCTLTASSIAVITRGKYAVLEAGAMPHLISLLSDTSSEVRTNSIKVTSSPPLHIIIYTTITCTHLQTLTMLAETPKGKQELQSILPQVYTYPNYHSTHTGHVVHGNAIAYSYTLCQSMTMYIFAVYSWRR